MLLAWLYWREDWSWSNVCPVCMLMLCKATMQGNVESITALKTHHWSSIYLCQRCPKITGSPSVVDGQRTVSCKGLI